MVDTKLDQPIPTSNYCGIDDLPVEVLSRILRSHRPIYETGEIRCPRGMMGAFALSSRSYSQYRLVSSRWNQITTPFLFREGVLATTPNTSPEKIARFFDLRATHIRFLLLDGEEHDNRQSYRVVADALGIGLGLCTKLETLDCSGRYPAFLDRQWMGKFAPNLVSTVTSLVINGRASELQLSHALVGLGESLQSLMISGWGRSEMPSSLFHLPRALPNLRHLSWFHPFYQGNTSGLDVVKELFRRISADKIQNPLESLHLVLNRQLAPEAFNILCIHNIGVKLTTLHLYFDQFRLLEDIAMKVVSLCCNLVDFSYISPFPKAAIGRLTPSVQRLELLIGQGGADISSNDVVQILRAKQFPQLRELFLLTRYKDQFEVSELLSFCKDFNIKAYTQLTDAISFMSFVVPTTAQ